VNKVDLCTGTSASSAKLNLVRFVQGVQGIKSVNYFYVDIYVIKFYYSIVIAIAILLRHIGK
jgi:hypothetical protein